jgi:hypothetical protein
VEHVRFCCLLSVEACNESKRVSDILRFMDSPVYPDQRPSTKPNSIKWYDNMPMGHNMIGNIMPKLSEKAGLSFRYTNHSLRATSVQKYTHFYYFNKYMYKIKIQVPILP